MYGGADDGTSISKFKILRVVRVLRLVKLARLLRASRILKRWETRVAINYGALQIAKMGFYAVVLAHWSACVWHLQTIVTEDLGQTWVATVGPGAYCVDSDFMKKPGRTYVLAPGRQDGWSCLPAGNLYAASIYWSLMTITSIGYGDITATHGNAVEQLVATFLMFTNSVMWGRVIATFCEVLSTMNPALTDFRITMDNLNRFVKSHDLPVGLRQRLRDYFHRTQHLQRTTAYRSVLLRMSPTLQLELLWHTNRTWLQKVPWLQQAEPGFITQLVLALKPMVFAPSEFATGNMLYIVWRGVAVYGGRMLRAGGVWGDDMLIYSQKLRSKWCARALTYLEVYMISRAALLQIAMQYQDTYKAIRKYTIYLALRRGILHVAQRIRDRDAALRSTVSCPPPKGMSASSPGGVTSADTNSTFESSPSASSPSPFKSIFMMGREAPTRPIPGVDNAPLEWAVDDMIKSSSSKKAKLVLSDLEVLGDRRNGKLDTGDISSFLHGLGGKLGTTASKSGGGVKESGAVDLVSEGGGGGGGEITLATCHKAGRADAARDATDSLLINAPADSGYGLGGASYGGGRAFSGGAPASAPSAVLQETSGYQSAVGAGAVGRANDSCAASAFFGIFGAPAAADPYHTTAASSSTPSQSSTSLREEVMALSAQVAEAQARQTAAMSKLTEAMASGFATLRKEMEEKTEEKHAAGRLDA